MIGDWQFGIIAAWVAVIGLACVIYKAVCFFTGGC